MLKLLSKVEKAIAQDVIAKCRYCAVWALGPPDGMWTGPGANAPIFPVKFATSKEPDNVVEQADCLSPLINGVIAVVWCYSPQDARAVKAEIEDMLAEIANPIKPGWYDMTADVARQTLLLAAEAANVKIFEQATRDHNRELDITRAILAFRRGGRGN